ncbi:MAG: hypothetical protein ACRD5R_05875 [Candidatus Acidiferrales bacterium]
MEQAKGDRSIRIFYAWQNDLPTKSNRYAIKKALGSVAVDLEEKFSRGQRQPSRFVIDEATRDLPGSPHIPSAILEKIQSADVFVADVSIVNSQRPAESKGTPNPNVVFELGYAVAYLGWQRVLLLLNEVHGPVTALPFDFDRQRASPFTLGESGPGSPDDLKRLLISAVSLILEKDPPRPRAVHFDKAGAHSERDLENLRWLLKSVHWPTIDDHIARGAKFLSTASTVFLDEVVGMVSSSSFHLYDEQLKNAVRRFVDDWRDSMKYDHYVDRMTGRGFIFMQSDNPSVRERELTDWEYMDKARRRLRKSSDSLLHIIRTKFPEIDIRSMSEATAARYDAEDAELERRFARVGEPTKKRHTTTSRRRKPSNTPKRST